MLQRFLNLFQEAAPGDAESPEDRGALAACVVLLEAASADDEFTEEERSHIMTVLRGRFGLDDDEAATLMAEAAEARATSTDLWRFTRQVNVSFDVPAKIGIIEEVWRLVYSDGELTGHEDYLAHKLRNLLNLNQRQLIDAKLRVLAEIRGA